MVGKILCGHDRRALRQRQVAIASRTARSESDSNTPDFARINMFKIITALPPPAPSPQKKNNHNIKSNNIK